MCRARLDGANEQFFRSLAPATIKEFYPAIAMVVAVGIAGVYLITSKNIGVPALLTLLMMIGLVVYQFQKAASFWERSLSDDWVERSD